MGDWPRIDVSVDIIVFGKKSGKTQVLLIKRKNEPFKGMWALPGGYVNADESLLDAAKRELKEETGVDLNNLDQLYTFGDPDRHPLKRVISVAYTTVVDQDQVHIQASDDAEDARWYSIEELPNLAFDHREMIDFAMQRSIKK
jgi:8-oxo-dGTP diphosphatase